MAIIEIKHRTTGAVLFSGEFENLKAAVEAAVKGGADLSDAYLSGADLGGADLGGADLRGAYLGGADLSDADLGGANLGGADLGGAVGAPAGHVDPATPYVHKPGMTPEERMHRSRERHPDVPVVADLDRKILESSEDGARLDMETWHCGTTHCRAGWAITLAGEAGHALEQKYGPEHAGRLIYLVSTGRSPYFFDSTENALADIRRCAAEASP